MDLRVAATEIETVDVGKPRVVNRREPHELRPEALEAAEVVVVVEVEGLVEGEADPAAWALPVDPVLSGDVRERRRGTRDRQDRVDIEPLGDPLAPGREQAVRHRSTVGGEEPEMPFGKDQRALVREPAQRQERAPRGFAQEIQVSAAPDPVADEASDMEVGVDGRETAGEGLNAARHAGGVTDQQHGCLQPLGDLGGRPFIARR